MILVTAEDVIAIHSRIIQVSGGIDGLRDRAGLEAAIATPLQSFGGEDLFPTDIEKMFKGLSLKDKTAEETAGADVTSFRFNLSDGTSYDLIYACYGAKNGNLKSEAGGFAYFTSADIGSYWNNLNTELEAIPINESELP